MRATFFMLGWVAKRTPLLVREIVARGHELASHSFHHDKVHDLTPEAFHDDVRTTRLLLEDLSGSAVRGFRAPSFSINDRCWWAYDQLEEAGYRYSSSLHPIRHDHYGMPHAPLRPFKPTDSDFLEIPVATVELFGRRVSCAGGGHFRLFPYRWSKWLLDKLAAERDRTAAFYFHPWEIDPGQPLVRGLSLRSRLRHYTGLQAMEQKLKRLLGDFRWDRMDRLYGPRPESTGRRRGGCSMSFGVAMIPSPWRLPLLTLALSFAMLLALTADTTVSMVSLWLAATTYNHCFLVLPIALVLIWMKRSHLAALTPRQEMLALVPLLGFALLWLIGRAGQIQLFEHLALVGMAISVVIALLGRHIAKAIAFPLAFLFFMVPFGDVFVPGLQQFTANFSVVLLRLTGVPVFHDGIMIETPSGLFEVAEACAGIRFLIANIMVGALFAYLALRGLWKWALFMALAVILPIVANGLRAFGIILIAYLTDNQYAAGVDHIVYGWGFFAAIMIAFLAIGNAMADGSSSSADPATDGSLDGFAGMPAGQVWQPALVLPVMVLIMAVPLYANVVLDRGP